MRPERPAGRGRRHRTHRIARARRAHTSGGEDTEVRAALDEADTWLAHSEEAVNEWGSGPRSFAWETMAPCLARALRDLRDTLVRAGHDVPTDLESAEVSASAVTDHRCPRRDGSR